jgi:hypothetical protein
MYCQQDEKRDGSDSIIISQPIQLYIAMANLSPPMSVNDSQRTGPRTALRQPKRWSSQVLGKSNHVADNNWAVLPVDILYEAALYMVYKIIRRAAFSVIHLWLSLLIPRTISCLFSPSPPAAGNGMQSIHPKVVKWQEELTGEWIYRYGMELKYLEGWQTAPSR